MKLKEKPSKGLRIKVLNSLKNNSPVAGLIASNKPTFARPGFDGISGCRPLDAHIRVMVV